MQKLNGINPIIITTYEDAKSQLQVKMHIDLYISVRKLFMFWSTSRKVSIRM
jgi:hypothetical protein